MTTRPNTPRYVSIRESIRRQIQRGELTPNHKIAPEEQIARDFDVSRMTANKAIRDLVRDGYLVRQAGLGTFVTDRKAESSLLEIHNIADEVRQRGHAYRNDVLCRETVAADDALALQLDVCRDDRVFHTVLIHRENDVPIQLEDRYVNPRWAPGYLDADFVSQTPNEVLVAACPISDLEHIVEALPADANTAAWLEIAPHDACLCMTRRTWSADRLVSFARLTHPGERYKLRSRRKNADAGIEGHY